MEKMLLYNSIILFQILCIECSVTSGITGKRVILYEKIDQKYRITFFSYKVSIAQIMYH